MTLNLGRFCFEMFVNIREHTLLRKKLHLFLYDEAMPHLDTEEKSRSMGPAETDCPHSGTDPTERN